MQDFLQNKRLWALPLTCIAALLSACGGSTDSTADTAQAQSAAPLATASTILTLDPGSLAPADAQQFAQPSFHMAPVLLDVPADAAPGDAAPSSVHTQTVPTAFRRLDSRRLTVDALRQVQALRSADSTADADTSAATPLATTTTVATYTPAQIRAAYGLPTLPASFTGLTTAQAAQLGAGQTIYIVDAQHNPNVAAELSAFNTKFGLPACTTKAIATNASLPLATASSTACELSVVYSTAAGAMTSSAPSYDSGWATEIALDVQWAHATAPLARIVLIETASSSYDNLLGGVRLANNLGAGIVSMSFGGSESSGTSSADSVFSAANMTYLAATGDSGAGVAWPSVSPKVLAVGGTTLTYTGGTRSEVVWSSTGGGVSQYVATPSYQSTAVPGMGTAARRTVADVAFNADPNSGQYVAVIASGGSTVKWTSVGGTSLATPQWAGLIAVANALRAVNGKAVLAAPHAALYTNISTVAGTYASVFADITKGSHGSCSACSGEVGYDQATGLGTPNATALLSTLSGLTVQTAPVVTSASISGKAGTALSFTVSVTASNAVSYTLTGAPSGMAISSAGVVSWAAPVAGTYSVTVTAKDSKTGLSGQGVYTVVIAAASTTTTGTTGTGTTGTATGGGPVIKASAITGVAGRALSGTISISDATSKSVSVSISGAPLGMSFQVSGMQIVASWASPQTGSYPLKVVATDGNGASAQVTVPVTVTAR
ncbi:peptidase S53 [Pseudoduganella sp. FT25W]|uniref:Peptidase S53 n=1 Tax=Duganella alba TaxID=2666081 RepID=A0A6L5QNP8_9BURK|nr:S53 family peptidase [Duganella alba]MRX11483.1 peptidase S53 [Duganella alba]MRX19630.1 peptidase S53 [Duganella alba]